MMTEVIATVAIGLAATIAPMVIMSILAIPVVIGKCLDHLDCSGVSFFGVRTAKVFSLLRPAIAHRISVRFCVLRSALFLLLVLGLVISPAPVTIMPGTMGQRLAASGTRSDAGASTMTSATTPLSVLFSTCAATYQKVSITLPIKGVKGVQGHGLAVSGPEPDQKCRGGSENARDAFTLCPEVSTTYSLHLWDATMVASAVSIDCENLQAVTLGLTTFQEMVKWNVIPTPICCNQPSRVPRPRRADYHLHLGGTGPRVVLYIRVSSYKQANGPSPEAQEDELIKLAKSLNPSEIYVLFDYAKSGKEDSTRKTRLIVRMQRANLVDELLVRHVDRAGREAWDLAELCMPFIRRGGKVRTLERVYEHKPDDFGALSDEFVAAEKQNIRNLESMRASKEKIFLEGNWNHSSIPPSYRKKEGTNWIERDPEWEGVMDAMLKTFLEKRSWSETLAVVPEKLRSKVKRDSLRNLFHNPVIFGQPRMMRVVRPDESLRWFRDEMEAQLAVVFAEIEAKHEDRADEVFAERLVEDYYSLAPLLIRVHQHTLECGCYFLLDGTYTDEDGRHLKMVCKEKKHWLEFPLTSNRVDWESIMKEDDRDLKKRKRKARQQKPSRSSGSSPSHTEGDTSRDPNQSTL
jgi:DNA invertase Pin-like site-specific DNA recombinase